MDTEVVGMAAARPDGWLAGRLVEQQRFVSALQGAASGNPCVVVVHGEVGVGKTRLVREGCAGLGGETQVLWGSCVHFSEASVPFAPVTGALQAWLAQADTSVRDEVLAGADELGTLLPALGGSRASEPGRLLPLIDLAFNRLCYGARMRQLSSSGPGHCGEVKSLRTDGPRHLSETNRDRGHVSSFSRARRPHRAGTGDPCLPKSGSPVGREQLDQAGGESAVTRS